MYVIELSKKLDEFNQKINLEYYLQGSGRKTTLEISPIYAQYPELFTRETIEEIKEKQRSAEDPEKVRRLKYLYSNIVSEYLQEKVKYLHEQVVDGETEAKFWWNGEEWTYRYLTVLQSNEADKTKRMGLAKLHEGVIVRLNPLRLKKAKLLRQLTKDLGYKNYIDLCTELRSFRLYELKVKVEAFLKATEDLYTYWMKKKCYENMGLQFEEMQKCDMGYFLRAPKFDHYFTREKAVDVVKSTLRGMGINPDIQQNIEFDIEERPGKTPRAFCLAINAPYEVKLVTRPQGGQSDYQCLLHEVGHAEYFGNLKENLEYEYKNLGDPSITETYAFNLHYLTIEPVWLEDKLGLHGRDLCEYLEHAVLSKLYMLRRFAGKLLYEMDFHDGTDLESKEVQYTNYLDGALKIRHSSCFYLADMDAGFYVASYLRAWLLEAQLRKVLISKFGSKWYDSSKAGRFMLNLYGFGTKYTAEELAERVFGRTLNCHSLVKEFERILG